MLSSEPIKLPCRLSIDPAADCFAAIGPVQFRSAQAHIKAIATRDVDQAQEWTRKHLIDFQREYMLAKIPMNTPVHMHHVEKG